MRALVLLAVVACQPPNVGPMVYEWDIAQSTNQALRSAKLTGRTVSEVTVSDPGVVSFVLRVATESANDHRFPTMVAVFPEGKDFNFLRGHCEGPGPDLVVDCTIEGTKAAVPVVETFRIDGAGYVQMTTRRH